MNKMQEIDNQFRELSTTLIREYEEKLRSVKEQQKKGLKHDNADEFKSAINSIGLDISIFENLSKKQDENLKHWLNDIRPKLVERSGRRSETIKQRSIYSSIMAQTSSKLLTPYATLLLAPDMKLLEGIDGEKGNPWVLPSNPDDVRIKQFNRGSGWNCEAQAGLPPVSASIFYPFLPDVSGPWYLEALLGFSGFYIMNVHHNWWDCKFAQVTADVSISVFQYSMQGPVKTNMINRYETNVSNLVQLLDAPGTIPDITAILQAGDPATIIVEISLDTHVMGGGSYAEINFADGSANFINPGFVAAVPPH